jgi:hypothetical protein
MRHTCFVLRSIIVLMPNSSLMIALSSGEASSTCTAFSTGVKPWSQEYKVPGLAERNMHPSRTRLPARLNGQHLHLAVERHFAA